MNCNSKLIEAICRLACELHEYRQERKIEFDWLRSHAGLATKCDLQEMEKRVDMKLSEIKTQVAAAAARSTEAFGELSARIAALQQQINDLIAGAGDPDVTDEAFLTDMNTLKTNIDSLADIVPPVS